MSRLIKFKNLIENKDIDNFLMTSTNNIYYLTGFFPTTDCYLLYTEKNFKIFVTGIDHQEASEKIKGIEIIAATIEKSIDDIIKSEINNLKGKLFFEYSNLKYELFLKLFDKNKGLKFFNGDTLINSLREIKDQDELELLRKAIYITQKGLVKSFEIMKKNITEIELAAEAEYTMRKSGAEGFAFDTLIISGERTAFPHAKSIQNPIKENDLVIMDMGCKYHGYCSDMTRTFVYGKPDKKQIMRYNIVKEAQEKAIEAIKDGLKVDILDSIARDYIKTNNYGEYFIHSLGHGVGLDIHEQPFISYRFQNELKNGMIITIEPGIYIPNWGGIRIEDMLLVKGGGSELLTTLGKNIINLDI